jgi:hypothetical protein
MPRRLATVPLAAAQGWQVRGPFRLLHETLADPEFLNYRPSGGCMRCCVRACL